jgi:hypothetical protein
MTQKLTMRWSNPIQAWVSMDGVRTWPGGGGGAPGSGLAPQSAGILRIRHECSQTQSEAVAEHQILTRP